MGRHQATRTAGFFPLISTRQRAQGRDEPRGRLSSEDVGVGQLGGASVSQAMAILELIAERRAERALQPSVWADRIQLVP